MPLCGSCQHFDVNKVLSFSADSRPAGVEISIVCKGREQGCDFCSLLFLKFEDGIRSFQASDTGGRICMAFFDDQEIPTKASARANVTSIVAGLRSNETARWASHPLPSLAKEPDRAEMEGVIRLPVAADFLSRAAVSGFVKGRFLGTRSDSKQHAAAIKEWLQRCEGHPLCQTPKSPGAVDGDHGGTPLPTRCLEITTKAAKLRETGNLRGEFVILSHRWADDTELCKTTMDNYKDRLNGRGFNLTETFTDAINLAIALEYRYIWIDSVCIIQDGDDGDDWRREAVKMAQYYQTAAFTVFAVVPQDGKGIFRTRRPPFKRCARLPFRGPDGTQSGHFYVLDRPTDHRLDFEVAVRTDPLLQRGWIFQEWFLSRRIVYFSFSGIFFECLTDYPKNEAQEETAHGDEDEELASGSEKVHVPQFKAKISRLSSLPLSLWYALIEFYASLELKEVQKDRIIAIAGIAKVVRDALAQSDQILAAPAQRYEYVAGLWLRDIHHGLLWQKKDIRDPYIPVDDIPTWSWASLKGIVTWDDSWQWTKYPLPPIRSQPAAEITTLVTKNDAYDIQHSADGRPPVLISASSGSQCVIGPFDVDNSSVSLKISARAIHVVVRSYLKTDQYALMRRATGCHATGPEETPRHLQTRNDSIWFEVCPASDPTTLGGWASIEKPHIINQLESYSGTLLLAIHISTRVGIDGGAPYGYKSIRRKHDAYNVLFVESAEDGVESAGDEKFRRVGMGCVFDRAIVEEFQAAKLESRVLI